MYNIQLRQFSFDLITVKFPKIMIIGKTGTGKTTLIADLLSQTSVLKDNMNILFSNDVNGFETIIKKANIDLHVEDKITSDHIKTYINRPNKSQSISLIIEDISTDIDIFSHENIELLVCGYHTKSATIISTQYPIEMFPRMRSCQDYIFMFKENTDIIFREKLYYLYTECFESLEKFEQIFLQYNCIVICNAYNMDLEHVIYYL